MSINLDLKNRIALLLALPIKSLDSLALTSRLRDIGRTEGSTAGLETAG